MKYKISFYPLSTNDTIFDTWDLVILDENELEVECIKINNEFYDILQALVSDFRFSHTKFTSINFPIASTLYKYSALFISENDKYYMIINKSDFSHRVIKKYIIDILDL